MWNDVIIEGREASGIRDVFFPLIGFADTYLMNLGKGGGFDFQLSLSFPNRVKLLVKMIYLGILVLNALHTGDNQTHSVRFSRLFLLMF